MLTRIFDDTMCTPSFLVESRIWEGTVEHAWAALIIVIHLGFNNFYQQRDLSKYKIKEQQKKLGFDKIQNLFRLTSILCYFFQCCPFVHCCPILSIIVHLSKFVNLVQFWPMLSMLLNVVQFCPMLFTLSNIDNVSHI